MTAAVATELTIDYGQVELLPVHFDDLDPMGMVHYARYAPLIERALSTFWRRHGHSFHEGRPTTSDAFNVVKEFAKPTADIRCALMASLRPGCTSPVSQPGRRRRTEDSSSRPGSAGVRGQPDGARSAVGGACDASMSRGAGAFDARQSRCNRWAANAPAAGRMATEGTPYRSSNMDPATDSTSRPSPNAPSRIASDEDGPSIRRRGRQIAAASTSSTLRPRTSRGVWMVCA